MGTKLPLPKKGVAPPAQFSAHIYYGQMAGWIEMAHGTEMGLGPVNIVLDGDRAPTQKRGRSLPPQCSADFYCGATWYGGRPHSGNFVLYGDAAPSQKEDGVPQLSAHVHCSEMSIVAKRLDGSRWHVA